MRKGFICSPKAEVATLNGFCQAHGAEYRHGGRSGCLEGTREGVLDEIEHQAADLNKSPVFWLNGLAGTGKSTIAQTIAERMFADRCFGASFCSRAFEDRSDLHYIFPTLVFQLAHRYPCFRSALVPVLRSHPDVMHEPLCSQMQKLIVGPLGQQTFPRLSLSTPSTSERIKNRNLRSSSCWDSQFLRFPASNSS